MSNIGKLYACYNFLQCDITLTTPLLSTQQLYVYNIKRIARESFALTFGSFVYLFYNRFYNWQTAWRHVLFDLISVLAVRSWTLPALLCGYFISNCYSLKQDNEFSVLLRGAAYK